jgi:hypothetical protein
MIWEPKPGMVIQHIHSGQKSKILNLIHPAQPDGTGALWSVFDEGAIMGGFAYEANLLTYWEPVVEAVKKK